MTLAPVTAQLVSDWITEGRNDIDARAFAPGRFERQPDARAADASARSAA